jgi:hypothetical protein
MRQGDPAIVDNMAKTDTMMPPISKDVWCCMERVLSLQDDFKAEKPLIQTIIEGSGHICLFLPQFHCELNPIEML